MFQARKRPSWPSLLCSPVPLARSFCFSWPGRLPSCHRPRGRRRGRLVTSFGKLCATSGPGLRFMFGRRLPWTRLFHVSTARDFRTFVNVHVNDSKGTSVLVDVWLELRVDDPIKATFASRIGIARYEIWFAPAIASILGDRKSTNPSEPCRARRDAEGRDRDDCERGGIRVERRPTCSGSGCAPKSSGKSWPACRRCLERAKAEIEEGADGSPSRCSRPDQRPRCGARSQAKGQYPEAVGRAHQGMSDKPRVPEAYDNSMRSRKSGRTAPLRSSGSAHGLRRIDAMMVPQHELGGNGATNGAVGLTANGNAARSKAHARQGQQG